MCPLERVVFLLFSASCVAQRKVVMINVLLGIKTMHTV